MARFLGILAGGIVASWCCAAGENQLILTTHEPADRCLQPGEAVTLTLDMATLAQPVVGYQAFLAFDPEALQFVSGAYVLPLPFGLPLIYPITSTPTGEIDVAAGIFPGQPPAWGPSALVTLRFAARAQEGLTNVVFRSHVPPTQLIGADDQPVFPTLLDSPMMVVTTSTTDTDGDGVPDPCDRCPGYDDHSDADGDGFPDGCDQFGDVDHDGDVDLSDWIVFQDCLAGSETPPAPTLPWTPTDCLDVFGFDVDGDIDLRDFSRFQHVFTGSGG